MGFIRQHAGFCRTQKLKLPSLVISRPVRFMCVKNTSSSDVLGRPTSEAWAPELECLGARRAPRNFYSGDQLWGLGALTKLLGSPKGSLKFFLEHSLGLWLLTSICYSKWLGSLFSVVSCCCRLVQSPHDVIQEIEKTVDITRTTKQKWTNNIFCNTKKRPFFA